MPTREDLKYLQALPLDMKVAKTQTRIREWVEHYGLNGVYVSFSGGKDSTVLLHIARELYPDIPAVFVNTGLEYPEIQAFVRTFDNVEIIRPTMLFPEVIRTYGYPMITKELSYIIYYARKGASWAIERISGERLDPNGNKSRYSAEKYQELISTDFVIGNGCCTIMKKSPAHKYERRNKRRPIIATMAEESKLRAQKWIQNGCNLYDAREPVSNPMSFWTNNDVLQYIKENNLKIASVYGEIIEEPQCEYRTTGCSRTGCIFCGFGAHRDTESRFKRLKETHPKQYNFCIGGVIMTLMDCGSLMNMV